jgi:hypothetical protein
VRNGINRNGFSGCGQTADTSTLSKQKDQNLVNLKNRDYFRRIESSENITRDWNEKRSYGEDNIMISCERKD